MHIKQIQIDWFQFLFILIKYLGKTPLLIGLYLNLFLQNNYDLLVSQ